MIDKIKRNILSKYMASSPGQYSISVSYLPWKKEREKKLIPTDNKRGKKTLKPILHPIFEKCAALTEDLFWQSTFMDCARGKFPRGYSYKNGLMTHKKGNKVTTLEIGNSSLKVFTDSMRFFQTVTGIMSLADRERMQQIEEEKLLEEAEINEDITWKEIKTEKLKEVLMTEFINTLCKKCNFNEEEKKELTTTIKKGLMLKYFNSDNIIMNYGRITEIDGLIYDRDKNQYDIDKNYIKKSERKFRDLGIEISDKKPKVDFLEIWRKFLESLDTKRTKKVSTFSSSILANDSEESKTYDYSSTV
jgi:hypothetical protein